MSDNPAKDIVDAGAAISMSEARRLVHQDFDLEAWKKKQKHRDVCHVVFALRFLQSQMDADAEVDDILAESELIKGENIKPMTMDELDSLCERVNCEGL